MRPVRRANKTYHLHVPIVLQYRSFRLQEPTGPVLEPTGPVQEPTGPVQACNGIRLIFMFYHAMEV